MNARRLALLFSIPALALIAACSSNPPRMEASRSSMVSQEVQFGNVSLIEVVASPSHDAGGAVLGALIGAVIGNQIGSGSGRAAATGLGAVGGGLIGNNLQKRNESDVYRVSVRLDNGGMGQYDFSSIDDLRVGDRVQVQGGQLRRV